MRNHYKLTMIHIINILSAGVVCPIMLAIAAVKDTCTGSRFGF